MIDGVGGECHAPENLPLAKFGTHFTEGLVGNKVGEDGRGKCRPYSDSISGPSSPYRVAIPTEISRPAVVNSLVKIKRI
jgi:hypothetical protein